MKQTHTRRDKGRAVFLAALMVLSVFAMSASFAGSAAASDHTISGEVTAADGTAIEGADVTAVGQNDNAETSATTDANGQYTLDVTADQDYEVTADAEGYDALTDTVESTDFDENNEATQNFSLSETEYTLTVNVSDENGNAVSDATVEVDGESATTGADGQVSFDLTNGEYTVSVSHDDYANVQEDVEINGADESLDVTLTEYGVDKSLAFQGEDVTAVVPSDADVTLRSGSAGDSSFVRELANDNGEVVIDTSDLEGDYVLRIDGEDSPDHEFEVAVQTLDAEFSQDRVMSAGDNTDAELELDSNRLNYQVEVTSDGLSSSELESIFGESVEETTNDGVILSSDDTSADFSGIDAGEYDFTVEVTDTDAEDNATIEVAEPGAANAQFDQSTYTEEAGDIVEFTVELENTDTAQIDLMEENDRYDVTLDVTDEDGDGEVTVVFNTYLAGEDNAAAFSTPEDSEDTVDVTVNTDDTGENTRLLPADFDLSLYTVDGDERQEVDVAALFLTEGSIDAAATGVAPSDADLSDARAITDSTTRSDELAEGDRLLVVYGATGVSGAIDVGEFDNLYDLELEDTTDPYDNGQILEAGSDYEVVDHPEDDRIFVVLDESVTENMEAGEEYELTLHVAEDSPYYDENKKYQKGDDDAVTTGFTVVERTLEITGEFDEEDRLQVPNSENATITGESSAAPGTEVDIRLRAGSDMGTPMLMTDTAEVNEDGTIEAEFDLSEFDEGQEFTVTMMDRNSDLEDQVDAVIVDSVADGDDGDADDDHDHDDGDGDNNAGDGDNNADDGDNNAGDGNNNADDGDNNAGDGDNNADDGDNNADDGDDDEQPGSGADDDQPGFGIIVALVALLAAAGFALRRQ